MGSWEDTMGIAGYGRIGDLGMAQALRPRHVGKENSGLRLGLNEG